MDDNERGTDGHWADRLAITELFHRYAFAIDTRNWVLFRQLFTPDVVAEFPGHKWTDLETWTSDFENLHAAMSATQHVITNEIVDVDGHRARAVFYGSVRTLYAEGVDTSRHSSVWYDDDLVRRSGGWLITRHTCRHIARQDLPNTIVSDDPPWKVSARGEIRFLAEVPQREPLVDPPS
jgi:hypothetical protein